MAPFSLSRREEGRAKLYAFMRGENFLLQSNIFPRLSFRVVFGSFICPQGAKGGKWTSFEGKGRWQIVRGLIWGVFVMCVL